MRKTLTIELDDLALKYVDQLNDCDEGIKNATHKGDMCEAAEWVARANTARIGLEVCVRSAMRITGVAAQ